MRCRKAQGKQRLRAYFCSRAVYFDLREARSGGERVENCPAQRDSNSDLNSGPISDGVYGHRRGSVHPAERAAKRDANYAGLDETRRGATYRARRGAILRACRQNRAGESQGPCGGNGPAQYAAAYAPKSVVVHASHEIAIRI